jgi:flagellar basal-body rod modification protein FlgD
MSAVSSILGQSDYTSATSQAAEDKDMFLKLLVAQLSNQDPLNPVEDKEFIAQLAQFTSVEELQSINKGITQMTEAYDRSQLTSAAALMGKRVVSSGYTISKGTYEDGSMEVTPLFYTAEEELSSCVVSVLNPSTGQIVYSESLGSMLAGEYSFNWNGLTNAGAALPDGVYEVSISAANAAGNKVLIDTQVYGDVMRVELTDGQYYLRLSDNRIIKFTDVNTIGYIPSSGTGTGTDTEDDTSAAADPEDPSSAAEEDEEAA